MILVVEYFGLVCRWIPQSSIIPQWRNTWWVFVEELDITPEPFLFRLACTVLMSLSPKCTQHFFGLFPCQLHHIAFDDHTLKCNLGVKWPSHRARQVLPAPDYFSDRICYLPCPFNFLISALFSFMLVIYWVRMSSIDLTKVWKRVVTDELIILTPGWLISWSLKDCSDGWFGPCREKTWPSFMRTTKAQTSLCFHTVWLAYLLTTLWKVYLINLLYANYQHSS